MTTLTGVAQESRDIRRYIKTAVFQEAAATPPGSDTKQQNTSVHTTHFRHHTLLDLISSSVSDLSVQCAVLSRVAVV